MPARVNKLIMAVEIALFSTRTENRLWLLVDISIEFTGKFRSWFVGLTIMQNAVSAERG